MMFSKPLPLVAAAVLFLQGATATQQPTTAVLPSSSIITATYCTSLAHTTTTTTRVHPCPMIACIKPAIVCPLDSSDGPAVTAKPTPSPVGISAVVDCTVTTTFNRPCPSCPTCMPA
ncbi:hypothetical protein QBC46DRAFT_344242 [Diplogelasinospora grovesii]|uniref:Uncharacterized protein n=1 Tax=Diplogelasinospora grovesii TaxID=303347 RepID=A0AAN6S279_9PEZI|nr:hypothetical protein QBC46DRAFT_344242 [Diplogelasinospora grovesii]